MLHYELIYLTKNLSRCIIGRMNSANESDLFSAKDSFVKYLTEQKKAHATILAYGKDIEQLVGFLTDMGKKKLTEVQKNDLEGFLKKLRADGYTPKSISRKINSIKTFYRFLKNQNFITLNPAAEIIHPKYEIKPPRILSKTEYRALRDACRNDLRTYAIVELFLQTGIRISELAALKLSDVTEKEIIIKAEGNHPPRKIPLNKAARSALDKWLSIRPKTQNDSLFVTKTGKTLLVRNIRTTLDRYFRIAGIENAKVNDLRHTFIAHHLSIGTPLNVISQLVGHKRLATTERYLNLVEEKTSSELKLNEL